MRKKFIRVWYADGTIEDVQEPQPGKDYFSAEDAIAHHAKCFRHKTEDRLYDIAFLSAHSSTGAFLCGLRIGTEDVVVTIPDFVDYLVAYLAARYIEAYPMNDKDAVVAVLTFLGNDTPAKDFTHFIQEVLPHGDVFYC